MSRKTGNKVLTVLMSLQSEINKAQTGKSL